MIKGDRYWNFSRKVKKRQKWKNVFVRNLKSQLIVIIFLTNIGCKFSKDQYFQSQVEDPGSYGLRSDFTSWTFKLRGGEALTIEQDILPRSSNLKVLPKVANYK